MDHVHDALFWAHLITNIVGIGVYAAAALVFHAFARRSLYRPTCIALCWIFAVLDVLLTGHTLGAVWPSVWPWLDFIDIGTRLVIGAAVVSIFFDTRRQPFAGVGR